jgi:predicted TIM-barrel fold metal-dependent hydrolase
LRPIIDAHHHLWQLGRFPYEWLSPHSPPRPFGDHTALKRDYLLSDYVEDIAGTGIVGSVFVEANAGAPAGEIEWVDDVAGEGGLPTVSVGRADLRDPEVDRLLLRLKRSPRMRGVRMSVCWDLRPQWQFIDRPEVMLTEEFRSGLASLTRHGLLLEVLLLPRQLAELAEVARDNPEQTIVVDHLGTPTFDNPHDFVTWKDGMRRCARYQNVNVKISGLWPLNRRWRPDAIEEPVRMVVDLFGPERCLWASNFPVEKLMCPLHDQIHNLEAVLHDLSEAEKDKVFAATANRLYGMGLDLHEKRPAGAPAERLTASLD